MTFSGLPPQIDYRNDPNCGQTPTADGLDDPRWDQSMPDYDRPVTTGVFMPPQPDAGFHSYDAGDVVYDRMALRPGPLAAGYTPDLSRTLDWERAGRGGPPPEGG